MDLASFRWLLSEEGQALLRRATRLYGGPVRADPIQVASELRRTASAEHASAAMTQVRLRRRARPKFGASAEAMYFTADGLEQATGLRVAEHRAARIAAAAPGSVLDLGCGVGGDLLALCRTGLVAAGVDSDELRVAVAAADLDALGLAGATQVADGTTLDLSPFGVVFADPSRRSARGRVFDPEDYSPGWSFVRRLLQRAACVKLAPGIPHELVPSGVEAEWVSVDGEVKEAALWSGPLALTARRATVIRPAGLGTLTEQDDPGTAEVRPVGRFLYEPDGAVIRSGLVTAVAAQVAGWLLDEHIAYVCGDRFSATPFARCYEILEELPFHEKPLRAALRERGVGPLTIKTRGVHVVPDGLRRRLALRGDEEATVVLTRAAGRGTALLVRPR